MKDKREQGTHIKSKTKSLGIYRNLWDLFIILGSDFGILKFLVVFRGVTQMLRCRSLVIFMFFVKFLNLMTLDDIFLPEFLVFMLFYPLTLPVTHGMVFCLLLQIALSSKTDFGS